MDKISAVVNGVYYSSITKAELSALSGISITSSSAGYDRRRNYEDHAQDTVQPYDAGGKPRPEFYRLYPSQAEKIFTKSEIESVKNKI